MIHRLSLMLCRFAATFWVGAALLFVVTSIAEQTFDGFTTETRDHLAVLRFPWYYGFGFGLVSASIVCGLIARAGARSSQRVTTIALGLLSIALILMIVDYVWIYRPLYDLITPPGATRTPTFETYHNASKWINFADGCLCLCAAVLLSWPTNSRETRVESRWL